MKTENRYKQFIVGGMIATGIVLLFFVAFVSFAIGNMFFFYLDLVFGILVIYYLSIQYISILDEVNKLKQKLNEEKE